MHDRKEVSTAQKLMFREPWDQVVVGDFSGPVRLKLASDGNTVRLPRGTQHVSLQFEKVPSRWCSYQEMMRIVLEGSRQARAVRRMRSSRKG